MQLCDLLKSRVECPDFLEKLECAQASIPQNMAGMYAKIVLVTSALYLLSSCSMSCMFMSSVISILSFGNMFHLSLFFYSSRRR